MKNNEWETEYDKKFYSNTDRTCTWHRNSDLKLFINGLLSSQKAEIIEMVKLYKWGTALEGHERVNAMLDDITFKLEKK